MRILEIYDIEVLANCFTYTGFRPKTNEWFQFVIWRDWNDYVALCQHLTDEELYMVGFNNEGYDYPIIHHILNHFKEYCLLSGSDITSKLYDKSQEVINMEFSVIADKNKFIPQLDLYRIWHFNNSARACSLKHLEVSMRMDNIEDMPFHHTYHIQNKSEIELILSYNKHDVHATYEFYKITLGKTDHPLYSGKNKIQLRREIRKKHKIPCLNYPDVKIGEQLLLKLYCDHTGYNQSIVKKWGTPRSSIKLSDCIFDYIEFKTDAFKALKSWLMSKTITSTKGAFSKIPIDQIQSLLPYIDRSLITSNPKNGTTLDNLNILIQDNPIIYGTGGLHHSRKGVYYSDNEWVILDIDVGSLYPSIAVQNNLYPEHLGPIFSEIYDDNIVNVRLTEKKKPKKERDPVIMEGFKLAANGRKII